MRRRQPDILFLLVLGCSCLWVWCHLNFRVAAGITFQLPHGRDVGPRSKLSAPFFPVALGWACWWLSLFWLGAGAPGSFVPGAGWWGCGFLCFPFRGRRPKDRHFSRYPLFFSSGTSVPCTRSPESAGHFVENSVINQMVGSRRSPGATILGGALEYLTCQPSLYCPADRLRTS